MKKIYVIICLLMLGFGLLIPVFGQAVPLQVPPESFKTGVNYSSEGNRYSEGSEVFVNDFNIFKENHVTYISVQLKWKAFIIEGLSSVDSQTFDETTVNNIKVLLDKANEYGLKVNLDFWFHCHSFSTYWRPSYTGAEPLEICRDPTIENAWLEFVGYLTDQFKDFPSVYSFTAMNEPFYDTTLISDKQIIEDFIHDTVTLIKSKTSKPVSVRFAANFTPFFRNRFSLNVFNDLDWIGITEYLNPLTDDSLEQEKWASLENTVDWCNTNAKEFWIFEFGYDSSDDEVQRQFYHDTIDKFYLTGITTCLAWQWKSIAPFSDEHFSINNGIANPRPAFYELSYVAKPQTQGFELNLELLILVVIGIVSFMFLRGKK